MQRGLSAIAEHLVFTRSDKLLPGFLYHRPNSEKNKHPLKVFRCLDGNN